MNEQERGILFSLANTMDLTRNELDGLRVVVMAMSSTLAEGAELTTRFAVNLQANIDHDEAISLASPMGDETLAKRSAWLQKLLPSHVLPMLRLP